MINAGRVGSQGGAPNSIGFVVAYLPLLILVITFGVGVGTVIAKRFEGDGALSIKVVGRQWFWDVTYPTEGVKTANEIHVPAGQKVSLRVSSGDVVHTFWFPDLDRKIDLFPGRTKVVDLLVMEPGEYRAECAEFCGIQHANMQLVVIVESPDAFETWLASQASTARLPTSDEQRLGFQVLLDSSCAYCHTVAGTTASGTVGPDLTHLASRRELAAGALTNTSENLRRWLIDPQHIKPGNHMPGTALNDEEIEHLTAYLESLE
ncbi:MAG TPA: c-type cytochrome [Ilumatobacteraceae bacterium]|nr:c-type cytochrome [Ilumatobacteraceae bacterium]